jgi:glycine betaine/proline transport system ATP-binding protein
MKDGFVVQVGTPEELVTRPVDDYVRAFVVDAPLAKVLRVGAVMDRKVLERPEGAKPVAVSASARLEDAMALFRENLAHLEVFDESGRTVGSISALQIVQALSWKPRARP